MLLKRLGVSRIKTLQFPSDNETQHRADGSAWRSQNALWSSYHKCLLLLFCCNIQSYAYVLQLIWWDENGKFAILCLQCFVVCIYRANKLHVIKSNNWEILHLRICYCTDAEESVGVIHATLIDSLLDADLIIIPIITLFYLRPILKYHRQQHA